MQRLRLRKTIRAEAHVCIRTSSSCHDCRHHCANSIALVLSSRKLFSRKAPMIADVARHDPSYRVACDRASLLRSANRHRNAARATRRVRRREPARVHHEAPNVRASATIQRNAKNCTSTTGDAHASGPIARPARRRRSRRNSPLIEKTLAGGVRSEVQRDRRVARCRASRGRARSSA